jgi:hypothetical protein
LGPLLSSFGGTPERGAWRPTDKEWGQLADCGQRGLVYVVLSPDADLPGARLPPPSAGRPPVDWVVQRLLQGSVRPAFGHFSRSHPAGSADAIDRLLAVAADEVGSTRDRILTDHLLNDMPLLFRHAWRGPRAQELRDSELTAIDLPSWSLSSLVEVAGPVPASLMRAAAAHQLTACLNFDGEHVDLAIARRVVDVVGPLALITMTDRTDRPSLGGQALTRRAGSTLWYQRDDVVAAGSTPLERQRANMRKTGLDDDTIRLMTVTVPHRVLARGSEVERSLPVGIDGRQ